jgi:phage shock protein A
MGVLSRINDIIRSNLNELVNKAENPEKLLNQAIMDMEEHLRKARAQVLDTVATEKTMEKKRLSVLEAASRWERRAGMALQSGDEALARQALVRKNEQEKMAQTLEEQIRVQREYVGALKQSLVALEERYHEARARRQGLVARAKAAKVRKKTVESLAPEKSTSAMAESRAFDTFDRMEDKVLALESQVEAYAELSVSNNNGIDDAALDAKFSAIEHSQELEDQLSQLKKQVGDGGDSD